MLVDLHGVQAAGWQLPRGTAAWGRTRFARLFCSSPPNVKKPAPKLPSPPGSFVLSNVFHRAPPEQPPHNITYDTPCHRLPSDGEISANYFVGAEGIPPQGLAGAAALSPGDSLLPLPSSHPPTPAFTPPCTEPPPGGGWTPRLAALHGRFAAALAAASPDFQTLIGRPPKARDQAGLPHASTPTPPPQPPKLR